MNRNEFTGFYLGLMIIKIHQWLAEEDTIEGHYHNMRLNTNVHDDEILKHVKKMEELQRGKT